MGDPSDTNTLGPKVALVVAVVAGFILISIAAIYMIKRRQDKRFERSIGALQPGSLETGGVTGFVAMNEMETPQASTTAQVTTPELGAKSTAQEIEALAPIAKDPTAMEASFPSGQRISHSWPTRPPSYRAQRDPIFEAPSQLNISAYEPPPRTASLHQRRASADSTKTTRTVPPEEDGSSSEHIYADPFDDIHCHCRNSSIMSRGHDSIYDLYGQPGHDTVPKTANEAHDHQLHEASEHQRIETNEVHERGTSLTLVVELGEISTGIGMAK